MLRVTLELLPAGPDGAREKLGHIDISRVAEMAELSHHSCVGQKLGRQHSAMVLGHRSADGPWPLVFKALEALGWGR